MEEGLEGMIRAYYDSIRVLAEPRKNNTELKIISEDYD